MAARNAQIVDLTAYREARRLAAAPPETVQPPAFHPVAVWVPVWAFVPVVASPWIHVR